MKRGADRTEEVDDTGSDAGDSLDPPAYRSDRQSTEVRQNGICL